MLQEKIAIRHNMVIVGPFLDQNLAASQTDAQLVTSADHDGILMPKNGWIVGMTIQTTAASSAGNLTVGPTIDGTEVAAATQAITTATETTALFTIDDDNIYFEAGNQLGVEITTDGDWTAETMDLLVNLYVVLDDWKF